MQSKIVFANSDGLEWAWKSLGVKRKDYRNQLVKKMFGEDDTRETILANCPAKIFRDPWINCGLWIVGSTTNKENHEKLKYPNVGCSKSYSRRS